MPRWVDATVYRYRNSIKIPPGATAARRDSLVLNPIYESVISPADMNTVVNDILNESAGFTHKNGREDTSNAGGARGGEPSTDAEGAAPSNCVELELCQFDRFAK
jgi:hypothetical protein